MYCSSFIRLVLIIYMALHVGDGKVTFDIKRKYDL